MTELPEHLAIETFTAVVAARLGLRLDPQIAREACLRRASARGQAVHDYVCFLDDPAELRTLATELTINETYFYRHLEQLQAFLEVAVPTRMAERAADRQLDILSAGCATGEEPYSLAMLLHDRVPATWRVEIRGIDIDARALAHAAAGRYSRWSLRALPPTAEQRWFTPEGDHVVLSSALRAEVAFSEHNLINDELWTQTWDIVFCRNVLMYLTQPQAARVAARLAAAVAPGGYLFLGHAEALRAHQGLWSEQVLRARALAGRGSPSAADGRGAIEELELCNSHGAFYYRRRDAVRAAASRPLPVIRALENTMPAVPAPISARGSQPTLAAVGWSTSPRALSDSDVTPNVPAETIAASLTSAVAQLIIGERFDEARALLAACARDGADLDLMLLRALVHINLGELTQAAAACRCVLASEPGSAAAHYVLAQCYEAGGDFAQAARHASATLAFDPSFALAHWQLARLARRAGDPSTARRELASAIALFEHEDAERLSLFGGGFGRGALLGLCQAELAAIGGGS